MGSVEIMERIEKIDEQVHDLKRMLLGGNQTRTEMAKSAARDWLDAAKKLEKKWPKAPTVLEMTRKDRRHKSAAPLH